MNLKVISSKLSLFSQKKKVSSTLLTSLLLFSGYSLPAFSAPSYKLTSFSSIRSTPISDFEKEADIINFDEFMRIYYYNYIANKNPDDKNKTLVRINREINQLKYSADEGSGRKPPIIMHWTDANNAMGVIKTLFQERKSMKEGIIGVDYVVTEPLLHPDYPDRPARAYSVKFSRSEVATTWFHVPDKFKDAMVDQDRKYNKAINIEIVGWRFMPNPKGRTNDFGRYGKKGIREELNNNYEDIDMKYSTYPTVLKLVNSLAEEYNFGEYIDNFSPEGEIDQNLKQKGIIYLNGPLSQYLKGHGLIALEHTLMFGGDYVKVRHDFTSDDLLVLYSDLKNYRYFKQFDQLAQSIENKLNDSYSLTEYEISDLKDSISKVKNTKKKEYLLYNLYLHSEKVDSISKINEYRKNFDYLEQRDREKLMTTLITKFLSDSQNFEDGDYDYLKNVISTVRDNTIKDKLFQTLVDRYTYNSKQKGS